ncbi:MAG: DUF975 family protein [Firmicutes bacterium]|nr:DUF975 family protein [Bacillota bacterium]
MLRYTRKEMKQAAKNDLNGKWGVSIGSFLMATYVPAMVFTLPFAFLYMGGFLALMVEAFPMAALMNGLAILSLFIPVFLISGPLYMGYYLFNLKVGRNQPVGFALPYRAFTSGVYGRVTKGYFMWNVIVLLWSLLLIVPGIVKGMAYAQMPYLMMDHPEMTWKEAMKESERMMKGHKMDYFVLGLSFFGWILLASITYYASMLYSGPYMYQTLANFYRDLRGETLNVVKVTSYEKQI